jgi:hypothetical protein
MRFFRYKLGEAPLKTVEDITLLQNERCLTKVFKNTLCLPILVDEETAGYIFHGTGQLIIDSIIETKKGAVGKPTVKDLKQPFIMLGNTGKIENNLAHADSTDLKKLGYKDIEGFVETADRLCKHLFHKGTNRLPRDMKDTMVFAFAESNDKFDMLVLKGDSLVYTSREKVFVSKRDKTVLTCPEQVVVTKRGKTVIIANGQFLVEK